MGLPAICQPETTPINNKVGNIVDLFGCDQTKWFQISKTLAVPILNN